MQEYDVPLPGIHIPPLRQGLLEQGAIETIGIDKLASLQNFSILLLNLLMNT